MLDRNDARHADAAGWARVKLRLIHWLLCLYPLVWRARYADEYAALLEEITWTPWNLADIVLGALDARLHPLPLYATSGRVSSMSAAARRLRAAEIAIFCAFAGFVVSYISFQRLTDPSAPFDAVANAHLDVFLAYQGVQAGMYLALTAVMVAGFPVAFVAVRQAWMARQWDVVRLFATPIILTALFLGYTAALSLRTNTGSLHPNTFNIILLLGWILFAGLYGVVSAITISVGVARTTFAGRVLRYALIPGVVAILGMLLSLVSGIVWGVRLFIVAPQIYGGFGGACASAGCLGPRGDIGMGSLAVDLTLMAISTLMALAALLWGFGARGRARGGANSGAAAEVALA